MNFLTSLIGQRIEKIVRHDYDHKFIMDYPLGIHLVLKDNELGLTIRMANDEESILVDRESLDDFKFMIQDEIEYGDINELIDTDKLNEAVGQIITDIELGQNIIPDALGANFQMRHPKFKGIKVSTDTLVFGFERTDVDCPILFGNDKFKKEIMWT